MGATRTRSQMLLTAARTEAAERRAGRVRAWTLMLRRRHQAMETAQAEWRRRPNRANEDAKHKAEMRHAMASAKLRELKRAV